jgi:hypothetical protein
MLLKLRSTFIYTPNVTYDVTVLIKYRVSCAFLYQFYHDVTFSEYETHGDGRGKIEVLTVLER